MRKIESKARYRRSQNKASGYQEGMLISGLGYTDQFSISDGGYMKSFLNVHPLTNTK